MAFEWDRIHKHEENIEREVTELVEEFVLQYYDAEYIEDLTEEQINDIDNFRNNDLNEYSVMQIGFSNVINAWEDADYEDNYDD